MRMKLLVVSWILAAVLGCGDREAQLHEASRLKEESETLWSAGRYPEGLQAAERAFALRQRILGAHHDDVLRLLPHLTRLRCRLEKRSCESSARQCESALARLEQRLGPEHPELLDFLRIVAEDASGHEQMDRAEALLARALRICEKAHGANAPCAVSILNWLGAHVWMQTADYEKAEKALLRSLKIQEFTGERHPGIGAALNNLAGLYADMGQRERAIPLFERGLRLFTEIGQADHPAASQIMLNLSELYLEEKEYAKAEPLIQRCLAIRERTYGPESSYVSNLLGHLATLYEKTGRHDAAIPVRQRAIQIDRALVRQGGVPTQISLAIKLAAHGALQRQLGHYEQAQSLYDEALATAPEKNLQTYPEFARELSGGLAQLLLARDRAPQALPHLSREFTLAEGQLRRAGIISTEAQLTETLRALREVADRIYTVAAQHPEVPEAAALALSVALLMKGRTLDETALLYRTLMSNLGAADRPRLARLRGVRAQLAALVVQEQVPAPRLRALQQEAEAIEETLVHRLAPLRENRALPEASVIESRVAAALPKSGALVEIVAYRPCQWKASRSEERWGDGRYLALVRLPDQRARSVDLGSAAVIDLATERLLSAMRLDDEDALPAGRELHEHVMAPLAPLLAGRHNIRLSLDGPLLVVPFAAIHDGTDYLQGRYSFTYLTSGRDLLRRRVASEHALSIHVLAAPNFEAGRAVTRGLELGRIQALPGTRREAQAIQRLIPSAQLHLGRAASEQMLLSLVAPDILHIASHGVFWDEQGRLAIPSTRGLRPALARAAAPALALPPLLRSALLFSGSRGLRAATTEQSAQEDGLVTGLDVLGMNLWGTQLVVLSACNTGRGAVQIGQGVYGLRRAFFIAGAETLVTSLWQVSDRVTTELMARYYRSLLAGRGRAAALDEAAAAVRQLHPHPYYWAPFIVLGEPSPLRRAGSRAQASNE